MKMYFEFFIIRIFSNKRQKKDKTGSFEIVQN